MRNTRRLTMVGIAIVATGALFAGTARAAETTVTADKAGGTATASALAITLFGTPLTGSNAYSEVFAAADNPAPNAKATVSALLTPGFDLKTVTAETTTRNTSAPDAPACVSEDLEALPVLFAAKISCGVASAALADSGGSSKALTGELLLEPSISKLLETIQLQGPANDAEQGVIDGLNQIVAPLTGNPVGDLASDAVQTLDDVLKKVLNLDATVRIAVAPAQADVVQNAETTTAHAHSQGVRIEVLPLNVTGDLSDLLPDDLNPNEALLTITVGNAEVSKTAFNNVAQAAHAEAQAALVTIELGATALTGALGLPSKIEVPVGQKICVLEGTALESCVEVATAGVDVNGNPHAAGVKLDLLKGVNGGIGINTSSVGSTADPLVPKVELPQELPRTGGNAALPLLGGGLLCLAAITRRFAFGRR